MVKYGTVTTDQNKQYSFRIDIYKIKESKDYKYKKGAFTSNFPNIRWPEIFMQIIDLLYSKSSIQILSVNGAQLRKLYRNCSFIKVKPSRTICMRLKLQLKSNANPDFYTNFPDLWKILHTRSMVGNIFLCQDLACDAFLVNTSFIKNNCPCIRAIFNVMVYLPITSQKDTTEKYWPSDLFPYRPRSRISKTHLFAACELKLYTWNAWTRFVNALNNTFNTDKPVESFFFSSSLEYLSSHSSETSWYFWCRLVSVWGKVWKENCLYWFRSKCVNRATNTITLTGIVETMLNDMPFDGSCKSARMFVANPDVNIIWINNLK